VWNSALLLTRLLDTLTLKDPSWLSKTPTTALELGCGTGLASIAAAKCGAARVIATDGNPNVLHLARENVRLNHVEGQVRVELLQWGFLGASDYAEEADLMIGSDLLYNPGMWKVLAETISTVLKPGGIAIYLSLGHTGFNVNAEVNGFLSVIQSEGMKIVQDGSTTSSPLPVSSVSDALAECVSSKERSVLNESGGCRVVVLRQG
jgi:ribosomal protein L11 methylase PrmA